MLDRLNTHVAKLINLQECACVALPYSRLLPLRPRCNDEQDMAKRPASTLGSHGKVIVAIGH